MDEAVDRVSGEAAPQTREQLEEALLQGLRSGPPTEMGADQWQRLWDEVEAEAEATHDAS
jgi:hypothetical protein